MSTSTTATAVQEFNFNELPDMPVFEMIRGYYRPLEAKKALHTRQKEESRRIGRISEALTVFITPSGLSRVSDSDPRRPASRSRGPVARSPKSDDSPVK